MVDASQITHGAINNVNDWTDPTTSVGGKLDELASKTATSKSGLADEQVIRADGAGGGIQGSQVIISDVGQITEVFSLTGETSQNFTLNAAPSSSRNITLLGGSGSSTGAGGDATLLGGLGGETSGDGGNSDVMAGTPFNSGNGGSCNITARNGVGTNKDGGSIVCVSGNATGSGNTGVISFDGVDAATLVVGPASSTDNAIQVADGTSGKLFQDTGVTINPATGAVANAILKPTELTAAGTVPDASIAESNVTQHEAALDNANMLSYAKPRIGLPWNDNTSRSSGAFGKWGETETGANSGPIMPYAGSILAHSLSLSIDTATSGDVTFEVRINNANQDALELEFTSAGGTGNKSDSVTASSGAITFSAGDFITVRENESGVMAWSRMVGMIIVEYDS